MSGKLKFILPIAILAFSGLGAMLIIASKPDLTPKAPEIKSRLIRVVTVKSQDVQMMLTSQGTVTPRTESALVSQVAGMIKSISPSFVAGGFFEKGEILVWLDESDYEFAVIRAKQQVAQAELAFQLEKQQGKIAADEWRKLNDTRIPALVAREPQLAQASATLDAANAILQQAELNLKRAFIRAPFAGRIRTKNADVGQYVTPGMTTAHIYSIDYAEVRLPLPDDQLQFLDMAFDFRGSEKDSQGPEVLLKANFAGSQQTWQAYLTRIEAEIDNRSRMIHVVARAENPYAQSQNKKKPPLAAGLFVQAEISGKQYKNIYAIPREAIRSGSKVLVIKQENKLYAREVKILRLDGETAYISEGLNDSEMVCLSKLDTFVDGMLVEPVQETEARNKQ